MENNKNNIINNQSQEEGEIKNKASAQCYSTCLIDQTNFD